MDGRLIRRTLRKHLPLVAVLQKAGYNVSAQGACYCPFHDDEDGGHASAKVFADPDGQRLWCFSERRMYDVADAIGLLGKDPRTVFERVWAKLSAEQRQEMEQAAGVRMEVLPDGWAQARREMDVSWRAGEMTVRGLAGRLIAALCGAVRSDGGRQ